MFLQAMLLLLPFRWDIAHASMTSLPAYGTTLSKLTKQQQQQLQLQRYQQQEQQYCAPMTPALMEAVVFRLMPTTILATVQKVSWTIMRLESMQQLFI